MKPRLLLIDNDPVQSKLKQNSFNNVFDVVLAKGSKDLPQHVHADTEPFHVIVLDLMPIRERFIDLTQYLMHLEFEQIPPIFILSHTDVAEQYIRQMSAYPMCDIVIKPVSLTYIEQRVNALIMAEKPPRYNIDSFSMDDAVAMHNTQYFMQHLSRCWLDCIRAEQSITLLYCNIDYFALMQAYHGKDHSHYVLRMVQVIMQSLILRKNDMAVRARRDDFYIVLPACDEYGVQHKLKQLKTLLNEALIANDVSPLSPFLSISVGHVTQTPQTLEEVNIFVDLAKARLNKAKEDRDRLLSNPNIIR